MKIKCYLDLGKHKGAVHKIKEFCKIFVITNNLLTFSNCGGDTFAHTYIEYLDVTYGWDNVLAFIETEDYESCFGKSKKEIYNEWVNYKLSIN